LAWLPNAYDGFPHSVFECRFPAIADFMSYGGWKETTTTNQKDLKERQRQHDGSSNTAATTKEVMAKQ
jgi:hypothetical protein